MLIPHVVAFAMIEGVQKGGYFFSSTSNTEIYNSALMKLFLEPKLRCVQLEFLSILNASASLLIGTFPLTQIVLRGE
jgi:hypothetical protein